MDGEKSNEHMCCISGVKFVAVKGQKAKRASEYHSLQCNRKERAPRLYLLIRGVDSLSSAKRAKTESVK